MSLISRITTWTVNQILTSAALNGEFNNVVNLLNNIDAGTTNFTNCNSTSATITTATVTTLANTLQKYRRPVLQFNSTTVVTLETGINGTSGQLGIMFPDGTYRTDSTAGRIQCNVAQVASLTGTAQSGIRTGSVAINTWYAVYAVKSQVNTTDIVAVADTVLPLQANYATLNTNFGTNGWVYLGLVRNGDNSGATNALLDFTQAGNMTLLKNSHSGVITVPGTRLAGTTATSISWAYSAGTGATNVPNNVSHIFVTVVDTAETGSMNVYDSSTTRFKARWAMGNLSTVIQIWTPAAEGVASDTSAGASTAKNIVLSGWVDGALGVGSNPIL